MKKLPRLTAPKAAGARGASRHISGKPHVRLRKLRQVPESAFPNASPMAFAPDPASPMTAPAAGAPPAMPMDAGPGATGE